MNLRKVWVILRREYLFNLRRPTFLFTTFGLPLFMAVIGWIVTVGIERTIIDISRYKRVGIVDQDQVFSVAATTASDGEAAFKLPEPFVLVASADQAQQAVRSGTLDGYYVLPQGFTRTGSLASYARASEPLSEGLTDKLQEVVRSALAAKIGDPALAARLRDPLSELAVYRYGSDVQLTEFAQVATFLVPLLVGVLLFTATATTSQFLMSGLVEEKENRMMELFATSARTDEILWGKLLGLGLLGLTQVVIWFAFVLGFLLLRSPDEVGQTLASLQLTPNLLGLILIYFVLGYFVWASIMITIGASVTADQESRQVSGIVSIFFWLPYFFLVTYFTNPNGPIPVFFSLFPLTAPVGMLLRAALTTVPPLHFALSIGFLAVSILALLWAAARIFRIGMLSYGKRLSLREIWRGLRSSGPNLMLVRKRAQLS
jgi:ABC-2 type transport system permease protein